MIIVISERLIPPKVKNDLSANPVMMPGRAMGRTRKSEIASLPKKRNRCTPKAAAEPSSNASRVAASPALTESQRADLTAGSFQATENQCVVQLRIGQLCTFELSNAKMTMVTIGRKRNTSTPTTHATSTARVARPSIYIASNAPSARAPSR